MACSNEKAPTPEQRAKRLRAIVDRHRLTYAEIAEMTGASHRRVRHWLTRPGTADHRPPSIEAVKLVELTLELER